MSELEAEWTKNAPHTSFNHWLEQEVLRLRAIEAAAREVVYEFSMPSELDGAEQAALDKLRLALSGGEGK